MKKLLVGITALVLALAFTSCASMVIVDETLPPEQTATVRFAVKVLRYNGEPVNKEWRVVKIPEGKAEFIVTLVQVISSYHYITTYSLVPFWVYLPQWQSYPEFFQVAMSMPPYRAPAHDLHYKF
ncbi:hypothetical protein FACS189468_9330 [Spirochaetia bacterium]|nr:hypothetical protein FACS189468_9330 [Spirochaetia bacterium]